MDGFFKTAGYECEAIFWRRLIDKFLDETARNAGDATGVRIREDASVD
jgi:hypothetical protein